MRGTGTVAVVDVGSNTIKVLCAKTLGRTVEEIAVQSIEARLGGEVQDGHAWLTDNRRDTAILAIGELLEFAEAHGPSKVRIVATSAVRDAANKEIFQAEVKKTTGWPLQILSEREEALLIGRGISSDPGLPDRRSFCAIDLGGGSMECIHYQDGRMERSVSLPLGAVRFTRNLASDGKQPISDLEAESIREQVKGHLERSSLTGPNDGLLIGCGGAFSVSRAIFADRSGQSYEETSPTLRVSQLQQLYEEIRRIPLAERCEIAQLPNGRADILPAALQILMTVAEHFDCKNYHHSHYNLRFGLAATLLGHFPDEV